MNLYPVSISLSSFGADYIHQHGQASLAPLLRAAGASHMELREELFSAQEPAGLGEAVAEHGLVCVYSSPLEVWQAGQAAPAPELAAALARAHACGAVWLKVSLGFYSPVSNPKALAELLEGQPVRLLVENDQTAQGGRIAPLAEFFSQVQKLGLPIGMTFDIGNWQWQQQSAASAALQLGRYVEYLHCKAVRRTPASKLVAVPPQPEDLQQWQQLMQHMRGGLVRAIEYPLQAIDLAQYTQTQVALLAGLAAAERETAHG